MMQIASICKKKGIKLVKVAKDLELGDGQIYDWANGKNLPTWRNAIRLADYLGVSLDELAGRGAC